MLAREYGWFPAESDELDWADIIAYVEKIKIRKASQAKEKLSEYLMLIQIIHTSKPQEIIEGLQRLLTDSSDINGADDVGDMKKLKSLKAHYK